ncbi:unnamed protein product [Cuscuta europaea]|uniref:Uncharacterized protein n=1 Tax=Cuscuta europaea TaxID=41803 RepID=A0A9P1E2D0_CUSEU|nr:unnamed protein product [Cuscuta europaea]
MGMILRSKNKSSRKYSSPMPNSIASRRDVRTQSNNDRNHQDSHGMAGRLAPTGQLPQPDLNHIDHGQDQENAAQNGPKSRTRHPTLQHYGIHMDLSGLVRVFAVYHIDSQLQALGQQRREEEEAEGDDLVHQQLLHHIGPGVAPRALLQAFLARGGDRQPHEDGHGEERVHIHQPVKRRHVDAGGAAFILPRRH